MANINSPRGFQARKDSIGSAWASTLNTYGIASGTATQINENDAVKLVGGFIVKAAAGDQLRGVFRGCKYVDPTGAIRVLNYWPAGATTANGLSAQALIVDDPNTVFEAQFTNSTTVPTRANAVGKTFNLVDLGAPYNGISNEGIDFATAGTGAQQFRCIDLVQSADNDTTTAYSRAYFVPALHDGRVNTGNA